MTSQVFTQRQIFAEHIKWVLILKPIIIMSSSASFLSRRCSYQGVPRRHHRSPHHHLTHFLHRCQAFVCTQGRWSAWLRRTRSEYKIQRKTEGGSRHGFKKKPREPLFEASRVTTVETRPKAPRILVSCPTR